MATATKTTDQKSSKTTSTRTRRRERKNIVNGVAHVNASFNNTVVTIADAQGNTIAWSSAGLAGRKSPVITVHITLPTLIAD